MKYDFSAIEKKWQKNWQASGLYITDDNPKKEKYYILDMFPYPSGDGLHVGHPKGYIATDIVARRKLMEGRAVLHPIGWDAFGLPAENYAIKNKVHPAEAVSKNIERFKEQLEKIGFTYDWSREINTTDPEYYKWTQWIFLQMFKKGLAYESFEPINWCPSCKTGLANEDLEDGRCERCGSIVEKKPMRQWVLRITDYAERLLKDLDTKILDSGDYMESLPSGEKAFVQMTTESAARPAEPFIEREAIAAIVEHWSKEEYIVLQWKKVDWRTLITGGVERGQTPEEAARAEILEETGFKNLKLVRQLDEQVHGIFFHIPKNENRHAHFHCFHFKLENDEQDKISSDEKKKHEILWVKKTDVQKTMTPASQQYIWSRLMNEDYIQKPVRFLLQWPESIKESQRNWIGRSEGAELDFAITGRQEKIKVFTTRADTLCGVTYVVLSPEHPLIHKLEQNIENISEVKKYIEEAAKKTEIDRTAEGREKIGVPLCGIVAINPATNEEVSVWIGDYVLADYGTGAVMAVPAHDDRDFAFAKKYYLPIKQVIAPETGIRRDNEVNVTGAYTGEGFLCNSGEFNGLTSAQARNAITKATGGQLTVRYKLRDWVFSRQRYWGEPIPLIHCEDCGVVPVPEKDLPVVLPDVEYYEPTGTGESPLAAIADWVNVTCPACGRPGKRETNTMPQWAGSSWYYLRYIDPHNNKVLVNPKKEQHWSPVDMYVGGAEHATRHLIYARFWHKFLYDIGTVSYPEPFIRYTNLGLILASDGRKMSKRWGNIINPDDMIAQYGADAFRIYEMFLSPFMQSASFLEEGVAGANAFLNRVWNLRDKVVAKAPVDKKLLCLLHNTIKKTGEDIDNFKFNTAVSGFMILANALADQTEVDTASYETLIKLLAPFAPHFAEEIWQLLGHKKSIFISEWPAYDEALLMSDTMTIIVQVNGKMRDSFELSSGASEKEIEESALVRPNVTKWIEGKPIKKIIIVKGKVVNIVI